MFVAKAITVTFTYFSSMETCIVIATDSRGRGLQDFIQETNPFPSHWTVKHIFKPGATVKMLSDAVQNYIMHMHPNAASQHDSRVLVAIAAGICNLTNKMKHSGGVELRYDGGSKPDILKNDLECLHSKLVSLGCIPKIVSIAPVSIDKYAQFSMKLHRLHTPIIPLDIKQTMQKDLERDVRDVNQHVMYLNFSSGVSNVRWDKSISKVSCKRRGRNNNHMKKKLSFVYTKLFDGCHPNTDLAFQWFQQMCNSIYTDVVVPIPELSSSDEDPEQEWDFKRH